MMHCKDIIDNTSEAASLYVIIADPPPPIAAPAAPPTGLKPVKTKPMIPPTTAPSPADCFVSTNKKIVE